MGRRQNPVNKEWKLALNVFGMITTTAQHSHALAVPRESLKFDGPHPYVFRVVDRKLVKTPVHIGIVNSNWAEITSGLSDGDIVARSAASNRDLSDGLEVTVSNK